MTAKQIIKEVRQLAEKAHRNGLRSEARTLFATELVMEQQLKDRGEELEAWASKGELQAFISDRVIHTDPVPQTVK